MTEAMSERPPFDDPIVWFREAFERARASEPFDPSRAALASVTPEGLPAVRFVLVKQVDATGFAFFTNYRSPKAEQLERLPRAALAFHWATLDLQFRTHGPVSRLDAAASDAYFASRPRGSQLAAWASEQSRPIESRAALEARFADVEARFAEQQQVERPPFWGGYLLQPEQVEVWRSRPSRLHDRWSFARHGDTWHCHRLQP
ncbi:MAG: pyridoxamine 5'-phosphate oxidase [Myxococcales bacterium]|nr:pyridoxamine 5'-phosphate oxidase [Myxococcales bacterium]